MNKKVVWIVFIIVIAFVLGLMIGGGGNKTQTLRSKASENVQSVSAQTGTTVLKPNLIGIVTSIQAVNNENYAVVVNGINQADFVTSAVKNENLKAKNYLVVVTPKTRLVKVATGQLLTIKELQKNAQVAVITGSDLSTALQIDVK